MYPLVYLEGNGENGWLEYDRFLMGWPIFRGERSQRSHNCFFDGENAVVRLPGLIYLEDELPGRTDTWLGSPPFFLP